MPDRQPETQSPPKQPTPREVRTVTSEELLRGDSEVLIQHGEDLYRLRHTRAGKLLLYK